MPHNWASAEFIRMMRHMLVLERGRELHLLGAMPRVWSGAGDVTELTDIPTSFGRTSLSVHIAKDGRVGSIRIIVPERESLRKIVIHLEHFERPVRSLKRKGREILDRTVLTDVEKDIVLTFNFR